MGKFFLFSLINVFIMSGVACQNFSGYVCEKQNAPIGYANIVAYSRSDSSMIKGTVSDSNGYFFLGALNKDCFVKISSIGYKTLYINNINNKCDTCRLVADSQLLGEIIVKGRRNIFKKGKGSIIASIENSPLSLSGNANDVLARLPLLIENNGDFQVMGKGVPLVYINSRLIEDKSELLRLKSNEIKSVEIITNPGVEYNSSTNSVIKIRTIPLNGEGFSGSFQTYGAYSKRMSEYLNANIKYRHKWFDIFVNSDLLDYRGDYARNTEYISSNSTHYKGDAKLDRFGGHMGGGINCMLTADQSFGLRYNLTKLPKDNDIKNSIVIQNKDEFHSHSKTELDSYKNYLNFYYNGKLSAIDIDFNADYSSGKEKGSSLVKEFNKEEQLANYIYGDNYNLFASKLQLKYTMKEHSFLLGAECSFTNRKSVQMILANSNVADLLSSSNKNKQQFDAIFANYNLKFNKYYASLGLRYEYTHFKYYKNNVNISDRSKKYNEFIPSITLGYEGDDWQGEISFRKEVDRPSYNNLSNKISYVTYCARWSGNPFLLPSINSEFNMQLSWKDFTIMATLGHVKKQIFEVNQKYQDKPDVILVLPVNLPSYNSYAIDISYNTKIGIWQPSIDACFQYQDLEYGSPLVSYKKPIAELLQRNCFQFKNNFTALLTLGYRTKGNFATAYTEGYTNLGVSLSKSFINKSLLLKFDCKDILNRHRESILVRTNGLSMIDTSKNTRIFQFTATCYFNKNPDRYKGKGAALNEIHRL